jgi:hypothetical protein
MRPSGLFDYQEAAVEHCVQRLSAGGQAVLNLGTGMGKTLVARECLLRLGMGCGGKRALVACPPGLVAQMTGGLAKAPWAEEPNFAVRGAETGKQLRILAKDCSLGALVVNYALTLNEVDRVEFTGGLFDILIVDEAHKLGGKRLQNLFSLVKYPNVVLFMSASLEGLYGTLERSEARFDSKPRRFMSMARRDSWKKTYAAEIFSVSKTASLATAVGGAAPRVVVRWGVPPSTMSYVERLDRQFCGAMRNAKRWPQFAVPLAAAALGMDTATAFPSFHALNLQFIYHFTEEDKETAILNLHRAHLNSLAAESRATPAWVEPLPRAACLLSRFDSISRLSSALLKNPPAPGVVVLKLSSSMSSAQRSKVISMLSAGQGLLSALRRASQAAGSLGRVLRVGDNWFLREVLGYVVPRLLVLAADRSVDVGYDLHKHVDAVSIDEVPNSQEVLDQLLGRVCRADVSRIGKGDAVSVILEARKGTLDGFFLERCGVSVD